MDGPGFHIGRIDLGAMQRLMPSVVRLGLEVMAHRTLSLPRNRELPRPEWEYAANGSSPSQRCGMHGVIPQRRQFFVEERDRNRASGHFERGDVGTDQRAYDRKPALFKDAP